MQRIASKQPNWSLKLNNVAILCARKLHDQLLTMFDECLYEDRKTYLKADFTQLSGQKLDLAMAQGDVPGKW